MSIKIIHEADCKRVFKRYDPTCPRCQELMKGAEPRVGWGRPEPIRYKDPPHPSGHDYAPNPGGYCNICGWGRDYS